MIDQAALIKLSVSQHDYIMTQFLTYSYRIMLHEARISPQHELIIVYVRIKEQAKNLQERLGITVFINIEWPLE